MLLEQARQQLLMEELITKAFDQYFELSPLCHHRRCCWSHFIIWCHLRHPLQHQVRISYEDSLSIDVLLHWLPLSILGRIGETIGSILFVLWVAVAIFCLTNIKLLLLHLNDDEQLHLAKSHFRAYICS
jgi:hypothetical protein